MRNIDKQDIHRDSSMKITIPTKRADIQKKAEKLSRNLKKDILNEQSSEKPRTD